MSKAQQIAALISSFPTQNNLEPEAAMAGYTIAVSDFSDEIVSRAVVSFLRGEVSGHDGKWLPTPAQLAKQCDKLMEPQRAIQRILASQRQSRAALEAPKGPSDERRAEIVEKTMEAHRKWLAEQEDDAPQSSKSFTPITADTLGDPRPLAERLNIRDVVPAHYNIPETKSAPQAKSLADATPKVAAE